MLTLDAQPASEFSVPGHRVRPFADVSRWQLEANQAVIVIFFRNTADSSRLKEKHGKGKKISLKSSCRKKKP